MQVIYESLPYDEFKMEKAVKEYGEALRVSALEVANKYDVPVQYLHTCFAEYKSKIKNMGFSI